MVILIYLLVDKSLHGLRTAGLDVIWSPDFHDVIYHIWHCNVFNRQRNFVFTTIGRSKCT